MITRLQIIQSMHPTLANALYLANISDLTPVEQSCADQLIDTCLSNIRLEDLTDADKRQVLTLLKSRPTQSDQSGQSVEDFLSPTQVERLQKLSLMSDYDRLLTQGIAQDVAIRHLAKSNRITPAKVRSLLGY